jgi:hypothetical protein
MPCSSEEAENEEEEEDEDAAPAAACLEEVLGTAAAAGRFLYPVPWPVNTGSLKLAAAALLLLRCVGVVLLTSRPDKGSTAAGEDVASGLNSVSSKGEVPELLPDTVAPVVEAEVEEGALILLLVLVLVLLRTEPVSADLRSGSAAKELLLLLLLLPILILLPLVVPLLLVPPTCCCFCCTASAPRGSCCCCCCWFSSEKEFTISLIPLPTAVVYALNFSDTLQSTFRNKRKKYNNNITNIEKKHVRWKYII